MHAGARKKRIAFILTAAMLAVGCGSRSPNGPSKTSGALSDPPAPARSEDRSAPEAIAREIADGVGEVRASSAEGGRGPVFVFEEFHTSRVGQLQIAVMLVRLHERHDLRLIGLEGHVQSPKPLDLTWFHRAGGKAAKEAREDVAVRLLSEGEMSAAEFMAMVRPGVQVRGLESAEEYGHTLDVKGSPEAVYLLGIAEKKLTQSQIREVNDLIRQKKEAEAVEYILNADPWVKRQYEALKAPATSAEALAQRIRGIRDKARELGVQVEPQVREELEKSLRFMEIASQRSATMTDYLLNLVAGTPGVPSAMIIGAAHSDRVIEMLGSRDVSFAVLRPMALNPKYANLSTEQFARKNEQRWARTASGTLGSLLNSQRKPPVFMDTVTAASGASGLLAAKLVAEAARDGKRVPEDIREQLVDLPGFRLDWDSFTVDGFDVIFRMWLKQTDGREREVWARVGTADSGETSKTLEQKLLQRIADLGGGGRIPPRKPPPDSTGTADKEGPGDGKRRDMVISRIGHRALVVFAESRSKVNEIGRLSG